MMDSTGNNKQPQQPYLVPDVLVASMGVSYKRLLIVWGVPPLVMLSLPLLVQWILAVFNFITKNHGILFLTLTLATWLSVRYMISLYAPSLEARNKALAQGKYIWPLVCAGINAVLIRLVLSPVLAFFFRGTSNTGTGFWFLPLYGTILRHAIGAAILGFMVMMRFVGWISVVRCSAYPLQSNPVTSTARSVWAKFKSLDAILDLIAGPSDTPGILIQSPLTSTVGRHVQRRYQQPAFGTSLLQLILALFGGFLVANLIGPRHDGDDVSLVKTTLVATCVLTSAVQLLLTTLDGRSHELNPTHYYYMWTGQNLRFTMRRVIPKMLMAFIVVPLLSIGVVLLVATRVDASSSSQQHNTIGHFVYLGLICGLVTVLLTCYLTVTDEAYRMNLCMPGLSLQRLVHDIHHRVTSYLCLDVLLNSVLHGNENVVRSVMGSTKAKMQQQDQFNNEQTEMQRVTSCMEQVAQSLVFFGTSAKQYNQRVLYEFSLEQDILRLLLLESFGGASNSISNRHAETIRYWVDNKDLIRGEPVSVVLVRGLCAYMGGLGEALLSCAQRQASSVFHNPYSSSPWKDPSVARHASPYATWFLPPGAIACAEYAVVGVARMVVRDLSNASLVVNWRSTPLSPLVQAVLQAIFCLRQGVVSYAGYRQGNSVGQHLSNWMKDTVNHPEIRPLLLACDQAAVSIINTLDKCKNGVNSSNNKRKTSGFVFDQHSLLSEDCREWLMQL